MRQWLTSCDVSNFSRGFQQTKHLCIFSNIRLAYPLRAIIFCIVACILFVYKHQHFSYEILHSIFLSVYLNSALYDTSYDISLTGKLWYVPTIYIVQDYRSNLKCKSPYRVHFIMSGDHLSRVLRG
jgi:hypothetical protein